MELEKTREILHRYINQNSEYLKRAKLDIKPDYSEKGIGMKAGEGYSYSGLEDFERDLIYNSIRELEVIVNRTDSSIQFNIKEVFITEKKAVAELIETKKFIENKLKELIDINQKYLKNEHSHYPLNVCINSYTEINDILDEIFNSLEFKDFLEPNLISKITNENNDLKFESFWRKRKWKYIFHLLAFIPFILGICFALIYKDNAVINETNKTILIVFTGIIMILFNLFFNNHSSFKNSFKLLRKKSREKLIKEEKKNFIGTNNAC